MPQAKRNHRVTARKPVQIQINPINGTIIALCDDGSMWWRSGVIGQHTKEWTRFADVPKTDPKPEPKEPEDDYITFV